ncbi:MAG: hypothetical protein LBS55_02210 [Prevotellaceae bacterium]|jgi:hypothetical protein|nr:hypothetical protein [Prevotellaceae bacterium]
MLVFEGGLQPDYVMDRMPFYEINIAIDGLYLKNRQSWEQTRMICYVIAQTNSKKRIKLTDIMKFWWEDKKNDENTHVSDDEAKRLNDKLNEYVKKYGDS